MRSLAAAIVLTCDVFRRRESVGCWPDSELPLIAAGLQLPLRNSSTILGPCASAAADIADLHVPLAGSEPPKGYCNRRNAARYLAPWRKMPSNLRLPGEIVVGSKLN